MEKAFKNLVEEQEILNAINLIKAIDRKSPKIARDNLGFVGAVAFGLCKNILEHLKEKIEGNTERNGR